MPTADRPTAAGPTAARPAAGFWPFLLLPALAALWVDFGSVHAHHRDDTLIFSLASVYAWSPYFWEQDRVGMVVPLVCMPVRDPWANLLVQVWLTAFMGLAVPLLAAEYARPGPAARWAGVAASGLLLAFAPDVVLNNVLHECAYPTGLFLGLLGLVLLDRGRGWWRWGVALGLFAVAHWAYLGAVLGLGGLVVGRAWLSGRGWRRPLAPVLDPHARAALVLLALGTAAGVGAMAWVPQDSPDYQKTKREPVPMSEWPAAAAEIAGRLYGQYDGRGWLLVLGGVAVGSGVVAVVRPDARAAAGGAAVLLLAGGVEVAAVATRDWPAQNQYHPRYVLAALLYLGPAAALPILTAVYGALNPVGRRVLGGALAGGLLAAAGWQYGLPSPANARAALDRAAGGHTAELRAIDADAVGGLYWKVWTSVYHANLVARERGEGKVLVGVAYRSWVWKPVWEREYPAGMTVAVFRGPGDLGRVRQSCELFGLTEPRKVGESPTFDLYFVRPVGSP